MTSQEEETEIGPLLSKMLNIFEKLWAKVAKFRFVVVIGLLALLVKIAFIHSTDMWDEGWFTAIASRMADGLSDPFLPLYYTGNNNNLQFFDKPPVAFWGGALLMALFGRTTFAAKGINIIGGAGLALIVYFLYNHQLENKSASVIAGLLVALAHFLALYSRTAYIDPFVVFMSALVMLLAIKAIDSIFIENNLRKGYILIIITALVNIFNLLTKAWQGVLTFPAIVIYLLFRYIEYHINLDNLRDIWKDARHHFTITSKNMEPSLLIKSKFKEKAFPFPYIVFLFTISCAFLGSYFISQLIVSSIILSTVAAIGCYFVFLRYSNRELSQRRLPGLITSVIAGIIAGVSGSFVVKILYNRLESSFIHFAEALNQRNVSLGLLLPSSEEILSTKIIALLTLEIISSIFGLILTFGVVFFISGLILDLFHRESTFLRSFYEGIDLIPLAILGLWIGYWFVCILLMGDFFNRDAISITLFGVSGSLLILLLISGYPTLKNRITTHLKINTRIRSVDELKNFKNHLVFLSVTIILFIISFYPFVFWVQYLDTNIANGTFPWEVRVPGELSRDPKRPNPVTYTFLFFEYYIGWRYTHSTDAGDLAGSVGSALNDYALIVMLPFFIVGIVAFFFSDKRNIPLGSALLTWLLTIPLVFFPAQFQLNYYYIPLAIPYFAIVAKGIEYVYSNERYRLTVVDNVERLLAAAYFYFDIGWNHARSPLLNFIKTLSDYIIGEIDFSDLLAQLDRFSYHLFVIAIFVIPFSIIVFKLLKTFPGIITAGLAYEFLLFQLIKHGEGLGFDRLYSIIFHELLDTIITLDIRWMQDVFEFGAPLVTLIGLILLIYALYWLKPNIKPQGLIILGLILSGMLVSVSVLVNVNRVYDYRFQECSNYIKNHGGAYNYSTWVINEAGAQFAMRYYLEFEVVTTGYWMSTNNTSEFRQLPFAYNSSFYMESYSKSNPSIKFWIVNNNSNFRHVPALALNYSASYQWLTTNEHLVCVDHIVGLTSWLTLHLFVNRTWIESQNYDWNTSSG